MQIAHLGRAAFSKQDLLIVKIMTPVGAALWSTQGVTTHLCLTCLTSRHNNPTLASPINLVEFFNKPKSICHRDFSSCGSRRGSQFEYHQDVSHCELQLQFSQNHFEPRVLRGTDLSQTAQFALIAQIWTLKTVNIYLHATPAWTAWSQEH